MSVCTNWKCVGFGVMAFDLLCRHRRAYGVSPASTSAMLKFVQKTYDNKEKDVGALVVDECFRGST